MVLIQLGLTAIEAKTYVSLTKLGQAQIKTISRIAKTDRANLYRTMYALQGKGLIQVTLGETNTYEAIPFNDGIKRLLTNKTREYNELKRRSLETIEKSKGSQINESTWLKDEGFFQIVPDPFDKTSAFNKAVAKSKQSIDTVIKDSDFIKISLYYESQKAEDLFEVQSKKGCHIRFILLRDEKNELINYTAKKEKLFKYKGAEIKTVTKPPNAAFAIIDRKDVFIHTKPLLSDWFESLCLRSNNTCLVGTIQEYFDNLWYSAESV